MVKLGFVKDVLFNDDIAVVGYHILARDYNVARVATADIDEETTRHLVTDLVGVSVVSPVPEVQVLVHAPRGSVIDSSTQVAVFHRGGTVAHNTDEEDD